MYILYFVYNAGDGEVFWSDDPAVGWIDKPSECQWIVPGTIDPKDD